jgi:hypothetical protein
MKTKTAYRPKSGTPENIPPENKPAVEAVIAAPEAPAVAVDVRPETETPAEREAERNHAEEVTKADEAAEALRRQVAALRQSEALLRQAAQPQRPLSRDEKLALWQHQGMPADQLEFLKANPELVDYSELAAYAANEAAQQGHERGSHEHMRATKELFDQHMEHLQQQAQTNSLEPAMNNPTPKFFAPPPPKPPATPSHYSAPVSRQVPGSNRPDWQNGRTTLTLQEKEAARIAGVDEITYAKNKLKMLAMRERGEIG